MTDFVKSHATIPVLKMSHLSIGDAGLIMKLPECVDSRRRLMIMGVLVGSPFNLVSKAPLGDPIEIAIRGYKLAIRGSEASDIEVTLL